MELRRTVSLFHAVLYGVGIIIGAGIYALIGPAAGMAGNSVWMSFLFAAIIASFTGLSYCELSSMFPKASAEYIYVKKASGLRFFAFITGWLVIFTGIISVATVSLGFAGYMKGFIDYPLAKIGIALIALLSFINYKGIKESSRANAFLVFVTVLGLIVVIFLGIPNFGKVNYLEMPFGITGILSAAALIFFAYIGFEDIANIAEETKNPRKNVSRAILISLLISTILYILVSISAVSLADWKDLGESNAPLALAVSNALGNKAFTLLSIVALFATSGTVLVILVATSRMVYGISKDRTLPKILGSVNKDTKTPAIAVFTVMFFSMIFVLIENISTVAHLTSLMALTTFATVNFSLILLRYKMPRMRREFHVPLNIGKFPIIPFLGMLLCMFMVSQFEAKLLVLGLWTLVSGIAAYFIFMKRIIE
jgi:APA family basic amino acid/polyamine antiporter